MAPRSSMYINRELSWLEFNQRVLDEALDPGVPLLDRLHFLSITASNLDEFFMVRVGGLHMLLERGVNKRDAAGLTPSMQLARITARCVDMVGAQYACYQTQLAPELVAAGIHRILPDGVTAFHRSHLECVFHETVYPVVSPMAVDPDGPFPDLVNLRLYLAVRLAPSPGTEAFRYALVPLEPALARFFSVPSDAGYAYMTSEDVVRLFIRQLFPGETVLEAVPFRITRNADMRVHEDAGADFMALMEDALDQRREGQCVRLELRDTASRRLQAFLRSALDVYPRDTYCVPGPMALSDFSALCFMSGFEAYRYPSWPPQPSPAIDIKESLFPQMAERDILLYHPYDSFDPVVKFVEEASQDPDVLAIKQTLYRTSSRSPVIAALKAAAQRGKYVTVVVELKARFDESRNIEWARELERTGAQVIYGVRGLKTHCKVCIVVRREPDGVHRYLHFGTGNYNEQTARLYGDISYFTCDPDLGADASAFFNAITGYSEPSPYRQIAAAPTGMKERLLALIDEERERRKQGQEARIRAKMNSLVDRDIIEALYRASRAGVVVELNVRGICCLRPGVKGRSENIRVVSIVDRFLEHARVFCFHHGGEQRVFISSADWMPRNLERRVELMVPVNDDACRQKLSGILSAHFADTAKARLLMPDGGYARVEPAAGALPVSSQQVLYEQALETVAAARRLRKHTFEPYRAAQEPG